jgi:hypothetical protein
VRALKLRELKYINFINRFRAVIKSVLRIRIRCLFDPLIRDPGWVKNHDPDPGSGMEKIRIRDPECATLI